MEDYRERIEGLIQNFIRFGHFMKMQNRTEDLKQGELSIVRCMIHHIDAQTTELKPSQISALLGLQQPTITPLLRSLEDKGYVSRRNGVQDRREVYFSLTQKTHETMAKQRTKTAKMFQGMMDYLGPQDSEKLMELMDKVSDYLTEERQKCCDCENKRSRLTLEEAQKESIQ